MKRSISLKSTTEKLPKKILPLVERDGEIDRAGWECALLTALRKEIKSGNLSIKNSKQFGQFSKFFISKEKWATMREQFFARAPRLYFMAMVFGFTSKQTCKRKYEQTDQKRKCSS